MLFDFPEDFHWQMHGVELVRPTTHFRQDGETFPPVRLFIDRTRINLYLQIFKYHYQSRGNTRSVLTFTYSPSRGMAYIWETLIFSKLTTILLSLQNCMVLIRKWKRRFPPRYNKVMWHVMHTARYGTPRSHLNRRELLPDFQRNHAIMDKQNIH